MWREGAEVTQEATAGSRLPSGRTRVPPAPEHAPPARGDGWPELPSAALPLPRRSHHERNHIRGLEIKPRTPLVRNRKDGTQAHSRASAGLRQSKEERTRVWVPSCHVGHLAAFEPKGALPAEPAPGPGGPGEVASGTVPTPL